VLATSGPRKRKAKTFAKQEHLTLHIRNTHPEVNDIPQQREFVPVYVPKRPRRTFNGDNDTQEFNDMFGPLDNLDDEPNTVTADEFTLAVYNDISFPGEGNPHEANHADCEARYGK
jgi:hypothetical protein